jgi:hypothetical protein
MNYHSCTISLLKMPKGMKEIFQVDCLAIMTMRERKRYEQERAENGEGERYSAKERVG